MKLAIFAALIAASTAAPCTEGVRGEAFTDSNCTEKVQSFGLTTKQMRDLRGKCFNHYPAETQKKGLEIAEKNLAKARTEE